MRQDRRPYFVKQLFDSYARAYARHFLEPAFDAVGPGLVVTLPWLVDVWGPNIELGAHVQLTCARGNAISLSTWDSGDRQGRITIGDHVLISPGAHIISSVGVTIGRNTMMAAGCYISDSDWHDTYDRTAERTKYAPVVLEENVWLGIRTIVGKGVTIGRNSIVGAGSVVVSDIPPDCIAAGNPARVVKTLDPERGFRTRSDMFADSEKLSREMDDLARYLMQDNTLLSWLRSRWFPSRRD